MSGRVRGQRHRPQTYPNIAQLCSYDRSADCQNCEAHGQGTPKRQIPRFAYAILFEDVFLRGSVLMGDSPQIYPTQDPNHKIRSCESQACHACSTIWRWLTGNSEHNTKICLLKGSNATLALFGNMAQFHDQPKRHDSGPKLFFCALPEIWHAVVAHQRWLEGTGTSCP